MIGTVTFVLCALTSLACTVLLLRAYRTQRVPLLLWSGLCFAGLFLNNVLLILDMRVLPDVDLSVWRSIPALIGVALLLYGLVWRGER
ncbi:MAG TPA: DUF5985 family protein [Candidatus Elarobacter sp.]|nr:DUF5985 family protein [Candidatus Elarobacter sp.]